MPRRPREKKHRGVFEREKGSGIWWVRFVDVDGKRKARCVGNFSDAVDFYEAEKVRIRRRVIAPIERVFAASSPLVFRVQLSARHREE